MYNGAMFENAGLSAPTNLEEFNESIRTLRDPEQQQFGYATMATSTAANATYLEIMPIVVGFGGAFVKDGQANATAPETVAALQWIKDQYDEQLIPIGQDHLTYRNMFVQGKVASLTIGAFIYGVASNDNPEVASQLTATALPFPGDGTIAVDTFLAVPKDAKNKDAAARFLMKILEDKWQPRITELTGAIPARPGMDSVSYLQENPWFQAVIDVTDKAVSYAPEGAEQYAPEIMDIVVKHYESMLFEDLSAEEAAQNMQAELEEFLASVQ
jgi:multiple sugar transport system substrate-binding protein